MRGSKTVPYHASLDPRVSIARSADAKQREENVGELSESNLVLCWVEEFSTTAFGQLPPSQSNNNIHVAAGAGGFCQRSSDSIPSGSIACPAIVLVQESCPIDGIGQQCPVCNQVLRGWTFNCVECARTTHWGCGSACPVCSGWVCDPCRPQHAWCGLTNEPFSNGVVDKHLFPSEHYDVQPQVGGDSAQGKLQCQIVDAASNVVGKDNFRAKMLVPKVLLPNHRMTRCRK